MENIILDGKLASKNIIEELPKKMEEYKIDKLSDIIGGVL